MEMKSRVECKLTQLSKIHLDLMENYMFAAFSAITNTANTYWEEQRPVKS